MPDLARSAIGPDAEVAYLFNPRLTGLELLEAISRELALPCEGTRAQLLDRLNRFLLDASHDGRRVLLLVDEAQNLPVETLEELRMLSNLETATEKLLQIVLFGQPELDALLDSPELRQLRQRIGVRWRLESLVRPGGERLRAPSPADRRGQRHRTVHARGAARAAAPIARRAAPGQSARRPRSARGLC